MKNRLDLIGTDDILCPVMITKQSDINLKQSQDFKSYAFGIKETGLAHIFNVLRNQLYSDKILAVIREYSANAIDAHAEIGKQSTPIKVTLPNKLNLKLKIRDFGRGLTEKQIGEIYAMYGESTKRGTNAQVGQLGLGCKSAFAYGDNFVINSYVDGTVTSYNAFIDPSQVGRISKLNTQKTDEPNGIEIVVPVSQDDVDSFRLKAIQLFQNFEVKPEVEGQSIQDAINDDEVLIGSDDGSWKIIKNSTSVAVMGNIPYPIDAYAMDFDYREDSDLRTIVNLGVRLRVDIGDLEVAASREALQYTKHTKAAIRQKLQAIVDELPVLLSTRFKECNSMWEAKNLYHRSFAYGGFAYHLESVMNQKGVTWTDSDGNTHKINSSNFDFGANKGSVVTDSDIQLFFYEKNRHGKQRVISTKPYNIIANAKNVLFVEDDRDTHIGRMNRIAPLLENYDGRNTDPLMKDKAIYDCVYLIRYKNKSIKKNILSKTKFDAPVVPLSSLTPIKLNVIYPRDTSVKHGNINGAGVSKAKHTSNVFVYDNDFNGGNWHHPKSDFFKIQEVDLDNVKDAVYVILDKFYIKSPDGNEVHPSELEKVAQGYKALTGKDLPTIYAFKVKQQDVPKNKKGWMDVEDWYNKQIKDYLNKNNLQKEFANSEAVTKHLNGLDLDYHYFVRLQSGSARTYVKNSSDTVEKMLGKIASEDSPIKTYLLAIEDMMPSKEQSKKMEKVKSHLKNHIMKHKNSSTPSHDLGNLHKNALDRYKMLKYFDDNWMSHWGYKARFADETWKDMTTYINTVDATYVKKNFAQSNKKD